MITGGSLFGFAHCPQHLDIKNSVTDSTCNIVELSVLNRMFGAEEHSFCYKIRFDGFDSPTYTEAGPFECANNMLKILCMPECMCVVGY